MAAQSAPARILLVDDGDSAAFLTAALSDMPVHVQRATPDGESAAGADLLVFVPVAGTPDAAAQLRSLRARANGTSPLVLVLCADDQSVDFLDAGADDVLLLPARPELLAHRVRRLLAATRAFSAADASAQFRHMVEHLPDVVFAIRPDTTITYLSAAFETLLGHRIADWLGRSFVPLVCPDDLPTVSAMIERAMAGEDLRPYEVRFLARDRICYGEIMARLYTDSDGLPAFWGTVRDVQARKEMEAAEREQRVLAEALRDTAAALNGTLDRDEVFDRILEQVGRVVPSDCANFMLIEDGVARIARSRGYEERGLAEAVVHLGFLVAETPNMSWMVETGRAFVAPDVAMYAGWVQRPETEWIRSYISSPICVAGRVIGFLNLDSGERHRFGEADAQRLMVFANQAATAVRNANLFDALRRQAEELEQRVAERTAQLDRERAQLQIILDSMNEGVIYDEQYQVRYINRALTELTGYAAEEWTGYLEPLLGSSVSAADVSRVLALLHQPSTGERGTTLELRLCRKDGSEFDASLTCKPVHDDGRVVGAVTVIRDISQEKALQTQKARFVAYASHELRTPITNLMTRLYLLRKKPDRLEEHLEVLEAVAERMRRLVEDMLDRSRLERGLLTLQRDTICLQDVLADVVRIQADEADRKGVSLAYAGLPEPVYAFADPVRISQVVTNLVVNAINYTPAGGAIYVTLAREAHGQPDTSYAVVDVEDTGIGIAEEHLPNLFQPFFRVEGGSQGTGLGLSLSHQIVEMHGGTIDVASQLGAGSRFRVRLPLVAASDSAQPSPETHACGKPA